MNDMIYRQTAIAIIKDCMLDPDDCRYENAEEINGVLRYAEDRIKEASSAQPTHSNDSNVLDALDCVSRQAAIYRLMREIRSYAEGPRYRDVVTGLKIAVMVIQEKVPSVQPERKKGKWIHGKEIAREYLSGRITHIEYKDYHCSECGYTVENIRWNVDGELVDRYCTACGAQMEVEHETD